MIRIRFDPASLTDPGQQAWWQQWSADARKATDKAVAAFEAWLSHPEPRPGLDISLPSAVWSDLKQWMLDNVFHQKCAYCEREISGYYGDAEHYRPKGAVERKNALGTRERIQVVIVHPASAEEIHIAHPGYFWLAYDWRNLVPACSFCNSGKGKGARFDIGKTYIVLAQLPQTEVNALPEDLRPRESVTWPGYYYLSPAQLDSLEDPLLLNPLNAIDGRDPRKHISFGVRGLEAAVANSPAGITSIETFQLASEKLRQARQKAQEEFRDKYYDALRRYDPADNGPSEVQKLLNEYGFGRKPFSAASLDYYRILQRAQARLTIPD